MLKEQGRDNYLFSSLRFKQKRLQYYSKGHSITPGDYSPIAAEKLINLRPEIVIVTAANNRLPYLARSYELLCRQTFGQWAWLIVDNLSTDGTGKYIRQQRNSRVVYTHYNGLSGYAAPVRNFGLDVVASAYWRSVEKLPWVMVVDSDDRLYDEDSLHELYKMTKCKSGQFREIGLVHGYSATEIHYGDHVDYYPNPRDTSSNFPTVENLSEVLYKGLNILAGLFSINMLSLMRYPNERSFEDAGFNEKLLLQMKKRGDAWRAQEYPLTVKVFHRESMSGKNNEIGNTERSGKVGPYEVKGMRADILEYYRYLTDYFVQEGL